MIDQTHDFHETRWAWSGHLSIKEYAIEYSPRQNYTVEEDRDPF